MILKITIFKIKMNQLKVIKALDTACSVTNFVYVNTNNIFTTTHIKLSYGIYIVKYTDLIPLNCISLNLEQRKFNNVKLDDIISVVEVSENIYNLADTIEFKILVPTDDIKLTIESSILIDNLKQNFTNHIFTKYQILLLMYQDYRISLRVNNLNCMKNYGKLDENTEIFLTIPETSTKIKLITLSNEKSSLFKTDFNGKSLGIGGLDDELMEIFRRGFASRLLSKKVSDELGVKHIRGILLSGPPGCGKTLIARQIGKMLNCKEPKIVQGPSLLDKYIGESEKNVRKLFEDAITDNKNGNLDDLHLIICDEFDALCKKRGRGGDNTGTSDNIVNTFLAMIDGPESLNNILLICMTNRPDMMDEAVLRPGRLELQIEISLPSESGRVEILSIHTETMNKNNRLDQYVDLNEIAKLSKNFTGAELEGLIKNAVSYAIAREIVFENGQLTQDLNDIQPIITQTDLIKAVNEAKPMFGRSINNDIDEYCKKEFIFWGNTKNIYDDITNRIHTLHKGHSGKYLICNPTTNGKTRLACQIIKDNPNIQFIKLITPAKILKESNPYTFLDELFQSSCMKVENSAIIFDNFERLIGLSSFDRVINFNNNILQAILVLLERTISINKKLTIIITGRDINILTKLDVIRNCDYIYEIDNKMMNKEVQLFLPFEIYESDVDSDIVFKKYKCGA